MSIAVTLTVMIAATSTSDDLCYPRTTITASSTTKFITTATPTIVALRQRHSLSPLRRFFRHDDQFFCCNFNNDDRFDFGNVVDCCDLDSDDCCHLDDCHLFDNGIRCFETITIAAISTTTKAATSTTTDASNLTIAIASTLTKAIAVTSSTIFATRRPLHLLRLQPRRPLRLRECRSQ